MPVSLYTYVSMFVSSSPQRWGSGSRGKVGVQAMGSPRDRFTRVRGWGGGRWDGEWLEMEERECYSDRGSRGRSLGPCS